MDPNIRLQKSVARVPFCSEHRSGSFFSGDFESRVRTLGSSSSHRPSHPFNQGKPWGRYPSSVQNLATSRARESTRAFAEEPRDAFLDGPFSRARRRCNRLHCSATNGLQGRRGAGAKVADGHRPPVCRVFPAAGATGTTLHTGTSRGSAGSLS